MRRVRAWCLLSGPKKYEKKVYELDPESLGVPTCTIEDLKGGRRGGHAVLVGPMRSGPDGEGRGAGDASENAAMLREVLSGGDHRNAKRDAVVLNAGRWVAGRLLVAVGGLDEIGARLAQ